MRKRQPRTETTLAEKAVDVWKYSLRPMAEKQSDRWQSVKNVEGKIEQALTCAWDELRG